MPPFGVSDWGTPSKLFLCRKICDVPQPDGSIAELSYITPFEAALDGSISLAPEDRKPPRVSQRRAADH